MGQKNMKILNIIAIFLIIICIILLIPCMLNIKEQFTNKNINNRNNINDIFDISYTADISNSYADSQIIKNTIPKVIIQIHTDKNKIIDNAHKNDNIQYSNVGKDRECDNCCV